MTTSWMRRAACRDDQTNLFFPSGNTGPALVQANNAKKVCLRCPVRDECLTWAMETGEESGVWGGLDEGERRTLQQQDRPTGRPPAECGTESAYNRHCRKHEPIDDACRAAHADHTRQVRQLNAQALQVAP